MPGSAVASSRPEALTCSTLELGEDRLGLAVPLPTLLQGKGGHMSHQPPHPGPFPGPAAAREGQGPTGEDEAHRGRSSPWDGV